MSNPLTDELTEQAKAELTAEFRDLARRFPSRRQPVPAGAVTMRQLVAMSRTGW